MQDNHLNWPTKDTIHALNDRQMMTIVVKYDLSTGGSSMMIESQFSPEQEFAIADAIALAATQRMHEAGRKVEVAH